MQNQQKSLCQEAVFWPNLLTFRKSNRIHVWVSFYMQMHQMCYGDRYYCFKTDSLLERYLYQARCFPACFSWFLFRCGICIKSKPSLAQRALLLFCLFLMTHHKEQPFLEILRTTQPHCQAELHFSIYVNHRENCEAFPSSIWPLQYILCYSCILTLWRASFYLGSFLWMFCHLLLSDLTFSKFRKKNLKPCRSVMCVW